MVIYANENAETFILTSEILKEHPNGYYSGLIWGKKGRGKTSYCIHTMKQIFLQLSLLPDDVRYEKLEYKITTSQAYLLALDHIAFDPLEIIEKCRKGRGGLKNPTKMIPVITWDDAGVGGSSYLVWTDIEIANALKGYNDILRRRVTGFLVNAPHTKGLLSFIRNEEDLGVPIIKCTKEYGWQRTATARIKREGTTKKKTIFSDSFSCYIPKWVYSKYVDMTEEAFDKQEDLIERLILERKKRFPKSPVPEEWEKPNFSEPV